MEDSASSVPSVWASLHSWFTPTVFFVLLNLMIATIVFTSNLPNNNHHEQQEEEKQNSQNEHHHEGNQPKIDRSPSILHRLKSFNFHLHRSQQEFSPETHDQQEALEVAATRYVFNQPLHHEHFDFDPTRSDQVADADAAAAQFDSFDQTHEERLPNTETHFVWEQKQAVETVTNHVDSDPIHQEIPKDTGFEDAHEEQIDEFQSLDEVYSRLKGGHVNRTKSDGELPPKLRARMKKSASSKSAFSHFEEEQIVEARRPATVRERTSEAREVEEDDVEVDAKANDFINKFKNDLKLQRIESIIRTKGATSRGTAK